MGPRSFDRGNLDPRAEAYLEGELQWGRDHSIAEIEFYGRHMVW